jgi:type II secretory pathway pseudopilin PulG
MEIKLSGPGVSGWSRNAWTLVEAVVAVAILGIMIVTLFTSFTYGLGVIQTSREDQRATQILTQKIEAIRLCTWNQLSNLPSAFTESYKPFGGTNGASGAIYSGTISFSTPANLPAAYQNQVRLITVSVCWTNYRSSGDPLVHTRQMQTQSALNGMQNYLWGTHP